MAGERDGLVPLGVLVGAHGVRGDLRVKLHNPDSELLQELERVSLRAPDGGLREVAIAGTRMHRQGLLLRLAGCENREDAEALRGTELCIPRAQLPELPEGEHYLIDLIGLQAQRPDGSAVGTIEDAIEYPSAQALRVSVEGGVLEVPHLPPYVVELRIDEGVVVVDELDDLEIEPPRLPRRPKR